MSVPTATRVCEKYAVHLELPEARRYTETIVSKLTNETDPLVVYTLTGRDAQILRVLLDRIEETDGPLHPNHA